MGCTDSVVVKGMLEFETLPSIDWAKDTPKVRGKDRTVEDSAVSLRNTVLLFTSS